jgi:hypothetical protein
MIGFARTVQASPSLSARRWDFGRATPTRHPAIGAFVAKDSNHYSDTSNVVKTMRPPLVVLLISIPTSDPKRSSIEITHREQREGRSI